MLVTPDNSLVSANYFKNKLVDVAYKRAGVLLYARFANEQLDGPATVINYETKEIVHVNSKKGIILEKKAEDNESILSKVF